MVRRRYETARYNESLMQIEQDRAGASWGPQGAGSTVDVEQRVLVIDLDGTLVNTDILVETFLRCVRSQPAGLLPALGYLVRGRKASLKSHLADRVTIDAASLPYNESVLDEIRSARAAGRKVALATASNERIAHAVAEHLGVFHEVLASDDSMNLSARRKRDVLVERYGEGGFDYVGNSRDDLVIFAAAHQAIVVNASRKVERRARAGSSVKKVIPPNTGGPRTWLKALRIHQWAKNALVLLPLAASHQFTNLGDVRSATLAFVAFGLCASSVYVLNDLLDLEEDRRHPRKRARPFASGRLSLLRGAATVPLLLTASFALAGLLLPPLFVAVLATYYAITVAYSIALKRFTMIDVIVLAGLYTIRIIAGAAAIEVKLTFWLLAFSMFLFLSLALSKRYAELKTVLDRMTSSRAPTSAAGRGYGVDDMHLVESLGVASGLMSVLVLTLYIQDPQTLGLYERPQAIWLACPVLLYWIGRVWTYAHRGHLDDDPMIFAIKDRVSLLVGVLFAFAFWSAS